MNPQVLVNRWLILFIVSMQRVGRSGRDRGDVPGWVMITVMTAALVLAILIPFREAIVAAVDEALTSVVEAPAQ